MTPPDNSLLLGVVTVAIVQVASLITQLVTGRNTRREAAAKAGLDDARTLRDRQWATEDRERVAATLARKVDATATGLALKVSADAIAAAAEARAHVTQIADSLTGAIASAGVTASEVEQRLSGEITAVGVKADSAYTEANHVNNKIEKLGLALTPPAHAQDTILVIDDDPALLRLAVRVLGRAGYLVRVAPSAEEALVSLTSEGLPHLIVVDLHLPAMDGLALTKQLRVAGLMLPIVAYSGVGEDDGHARREALAAGCTDFVAKTGDGAELLRRVKQWLTIAAGVAAHRR